MEKLANALFSMRAMAIGLVIFFCAIGKATFIESEETTQAAKLWIYNALWFEILLLFLSLGLIANIFRYKMWLREKMAVFAFHIAFLVIIIGAALTRWVGFEGQMHIREGESSSKILTAEPYFYVHVNNGKLESKDSVVAFMAESFPNSLGLKKFKFPAHTDEVSIEYVAFKSKYIDSLVIDPKYKTSVLDIVVDGRSSFVLPGEDMDVSGVPLVYSKQTVEGINVYKQGDSLFIKAAMPMQYIPMTELQVSQRSGAPIPDSVYRSVLPNVAVAFTPKTLYQFAGRQFAFKQIIPNASKKLLSSGRKDRGNDYLTVRIVDGNKSKVVTLQGGIDEVGRPMFFEFNGLNYSLEYGRRFRAIPFSVKCIDFQMERYPGSNTASSFASDIEIKDLQKKVDKKKHLFMNHVVDYNGLRFFQSSYDEDEMGTVLSVNSDFWGTNITYLGYLLMSIGMILSLTKKNLRFRSLLGKLNKSNTAGMVALMLMVSPAFGFQAQDTTHKHDHHDHTHHVQAQMPTEKVVPIVRYISKEHSEELATLLVQDFQGRIVPFHTLCDQLLRKLYRSNKYEDYNAVQVILAMHMYPEYWRGQKIVQVPAAVRDRLHLDKYASMNDLTNLIDPQNDIRTYKWENEYNTALRTPEVKQNEFQKKLIKLTEKFQVLLSIEQSNYLRIIPVKGDARHTWFSPTTQDAQTRSPKSCELTFKYFGWFYENLGKTSDYQVANDYLKQLKGIQRAQTPASIVPSETHVNVEIMYNRMQIFKNVESLYFLLGTLLLILFLTKELANKDKRGFTIAKRILVSLMVVAFLYHVTGLIMRGYVSGEVPWSNGYEALLYIAAVAVLAGFIFSGKNGAIIACAALLAGCMIMVTELELLDPEITPLQPVLKSYWLKIHVSVITASYAFLGLACILGLINLVLYASRGKSNSARVTKNINELTYVSEMTMLIGTFMLAIGTFLGGVWANESWGRYWGWDPKETWALVSVLVYAVVLHLRFIPGLNGKFVFNAVSFWAYSAILFTFFGVNFILVGLHSYAQGDGSVSLPNYVWYTVAFFAVLTIFAGMRNRKYQKDQRASL